MSTETNEAATGAAELASQFRRWQGLRWLPMAAGALLAAMLLASNTPHGGTFTTVAFVAALLVITTDQLIDRYYLRTYGKVGDLPSRRRTTAIGRYGTVAATVIAIIIDLRFRLPVALSGPVIACAMVTFWLLSGGGRRWWPVLAVAPLLAAFGPLATSISTGRPAVALVLLVTGIAEMVGGTLDHIMLARRIRKINSSVRG